MQQASAYQRRGRIFLHADSKTVHGLWIASPPTLAVDPHNPTEVGRAVLSVLAESKEGVPHPSIWKFDDLTAPLLKLAGLKSQSTFFGSARFVLIEWRSDSVTFKPYRNLGAREGFKSLPEKKRTSSCDSAEIGTALLAALDDAE